MGVWDWLRGMTATPTLETLSGPAAVKGTGLMPMPPYDPVINYYPSIDYQHGSGGDYAHLYRTQTWVHIAVNKLARQVARLPLKVYERDGDERRRVRGHELARALDAPAPGWSGFTLKEATMMSLYIFGNALWVKTRRQGDLVGFEVVPWQSVAIDKDGNYQVMASDRVTRLLPGRVVHFRWWNPAGAAGVSPLEALRTTLELEREAARVATNRFRDGGQPDGVIKVKAQLTESQRTGLRQSMIDLMSGRGSKYLVLDEDTEWQPMSQTAHDSQLVEHRKLTREEVAAVFDIPPPIIGILDHATFSNIEEQHKMLYQDTLGPPLALIEQTIRRQVIDLEPGWDDVFVEFDLAEVLKGNLKERAEALAVQITNGMITRNEARQINNLPPSDDPRADQLFFPLNTAPLDGATVNPGGDPPPEATT